MKSVNVLQPGRGKDLYCGNRQAVMIVGIGVDVDNSLFRTNGDSRIVSQVCYSAVDSWVFGKWQYCTPTLLLLSDDAE